MKLELWQAALELFIPQSKAWSWEAISEQCLTCFTHPCCWPLHAHHRVVIPGTQNPLCLWGTAVSGCFSKEYFWKKKRLEEISAWVTSTSEIFPAVYHGIPPKGCIKCLWTPTERELQRLGWILPSTWACMLKMWIVASKSLRHTFVSFLIDNVPCNTVNTNYSILYPSILNKLVPEVKGFPHTHREFLFIWLEYCFHFLFIAFSTELKSVVLKLFWLDWFYLTVCLLKLSKLMTQNVVRRSWMPSHSSGTAH